MEESLSLRRPPRGGSKWCATDACGRGDNQGRDNREKRGMCDKGNESRVVKRRRHELEDASGGNCLFVALGKLTMPRLSHEQTRAMVAQFYEYATSACLDSLSPIYDAEQLRELFEKGIYSCGTARNYVLRRSHN